MHGTAGALPAALLLVGLLLVELAVLYPGVFFRGEILTSVALGYGSQPWRGHVPDTGRPLVANPVLSDDLSMFTPWDSFRRAPGRTSRVPLWNPASSCGSPFLAANQTAVLAPTQLLRFIWPSPRARTLGLLATVIVAGLGMFVFLRVLAVDPWAALLGGVVWANSACMLVWMLYPLAETLAWFSWFAAGATGLLLRSRATRTLRLMTAAGLAAMLLAGHLPTAAQCLTVAALAGATWVALDRSALRRTARLVLPFVVGVLLATPQVLPTLEYFSESRARLVRGDALGPASAEQGLPPEAAWSWLVPRGFGSPQREGYRGPLNFNEATSSVGLLAILLGLAAVGMKRRRAVLPLAAITAACLVAAHGVPPLPALLGSTPVLKWAPGIRWVLLAQWAVSALAGLGAAALLGGERRRAIWCTAVGGAAMLVLLSRHPSIAGLESEAMRPHEARSVAFAAIELVIVASACALLAGRRGVRPAALLALAAVSFGAFGARGFNPTLPVAAVPSSTPETTTLSRLAGRERVLPLGWVMPRNTHLLAGLSSVRGWDAVGLERMTRFAGRAGWTRLDTAESMPPGSLALTRRAAAAIVVS
ncbi:MAG: hypothetical protein OEQ13_04545, partial [Acidobacteriota bacterium]|nr:hypothetical protein [Acidobacteriota bacterium]